MNQKLPPQKNLTERLIASALFDSEIASGGGGTTPPEISETTGRVNMKVLADVKLSEEARNQKKILT